MITQSRNEARLSSAQEEKFTHLSYLVGNTPMVELSYLFQGKPGKVYAKCEYYNLTGSAKDRIALHILHKAYLNRHIKPGDTIVEASSGNTGIAFAAIGRALGHPVNIIMPDWNTKERIDILRSMGARIILISREEGGFIGSIRLSEQMAESSPHVFLPRQFENQHNQDAHEQTTGIEIWRQLQKNGITPDAFVAGVGTGGTIMGAGRYLRSQNSRIKIHPLEPAESPMLTTGFKAGVHRIQGISEEFIPSIVKLNELDDVIQVNDGDAILMAQKLESQLGLAVGISSGANIIGAIRTQTTMGAGATVVTILCDSNKKYLSTDLAKEEPQQGGYVAPEVEFTGYRSVGRLNHSEIVA